MSSASCCSGATAAPAAPDSFRRTAPSRPSLGCRGHRGKEEVAAAGGDDIVDQRLAREPLLDRFELGLEIALEGDEYESHVELVGLVDALILTPSHQWPTGAVLWADARAADVAWAQRTSTLVVEDDYDAEHRYDRAPIGAIQGLAPGQVAHAGTASKTLAPGFRLGWFVLPPRLIEAFAEEKVIADRGSPVVDQLAFADALVRGEFDRHLRRMRPIYRDRRDALIEGLAERLPRLGPTGIAAGLHLVAWLPDGVAEAEVVAAAADHGVAIAGVSPYRLTASDQGGLIFGYSDLSSTAIRRGVRLLAEALAES